MGDDVVSSVRPSIGRADVRYRLEAAVEANRFTIAVVFPLVGAITLVASAEGLLPPLLAYNSLLLLFGTLVMRSPLLVGLLPTIGWRALGFLAILTAYTYGIEYIGVRTGVPYGSFEYAVSLGPMLLGAVPLALPLFFIPLVLNAYLLTLLVLGERALSRVERVAVAIGIVVAIDLVLDPAAVAIGFWAFDPPGPYYGVPISNYLGWVLSATVAVLLVDFGFDRESVLERANRCRFILDDLVSFVLLWGAINLLYGNWIAAFVAGVLALCLFQTDRYDSDMWPRIARPGS